MKTEKLFFLTTGGRFETDLIVWVWRHFFFLIYFLFSQPGKKTNPKNNIFQEPNRSVNVMFAVFDSADASGRIFCLWCCSFDERLLKGLRCVFFFFHFCFFPLSFLVVMQRFYLFWYYSSWSRRSPHSDTFRAVFLFTVCQPNLLQLSVNPV